MNQAWSGRHCLLTVGGAGGRAGPGQGPAGARQAGPAEEVAGKARKRWHSQVDERQESTGKELLIWKRRARTHVASGIRPTLGLTPRWAAFPQTLHFA